MSSRFLGILIGLAYLGAPVVWGYPFGFLWWHSLLLGSAIIAITISFNVGINRVSGWLLIAAGVYSMLAPFIHDYLPNAQAFFNDNVLGIATILTGVAMGAAAIVDAENRQLA